MYLYDEGTVIGLLYGYDTTDLQPFYYQRNIFGDVIAIRDTVGTKVVEYAYDAWGNSTVVSYSNADLANYNPIRYRGYYYDRETKLYYCNARYYDPEWRRFLSHDDTSYLDPENFSGLNLYAYCYNDPVNYADPSGHSVMLGLIGFGIGVFCGLGYGAYKDYKDDREINGSVGWQTYLASSLMWGAIGFGFGYFWPLISSFLGSSFSFTLPSAEAVVAGEALALAEGITITVTGAQIIGGIGSIGAIISMISTKNSYGGYYGVKHPGDHSPNHIHLQGTDGTDIRIGENGLPLEGEPALTPQQKKALKHLWREICGKLFPWGNIT